MNISLKLDERISDGVHVIRINNLVIHEYPIGTPYEDMVREMEMLDQFFMKMASAVAVSVLIELIPLFKENGLETSCVNSIIMATLQKEFPESYKQVLKDNL